MEGFCARIWSTTDEIAVVTPLAASTEHGFAFHAAYAVWTLAYESTGTIAPVDARRAVGRDVLQVGHDLRLRR